MAKVLTFLQMEIFTLVNIRMENLRAKDNIHGKTDHFILEISKMD